MKMNARRNLPYREFVKMWFDDSITKKDIAEHFKVSDFLIKSFARRCKLESRDEKPEVIPGGCIDETPPKD